MGRNPLEQGRCSKAPTHSTAKLSWSWADPRVKYHTLFHNTACGLLSVFMPSGRKSPVFMGPGVDGGMHVGSESRGMHMESGVNENCARGLRLMGDAYAVWGPWGMHMGLMGGACGVWLPMVLAVHTAPCLGALLT